MASNGRRHSHVQTTSSSGQHRSQSRTGGGGGGGGRETSWLRNNWTESETREVMEILVSEFLANEYCTGAYSKSHAPDARFANLSFSRPPRELYNKVQNLRQRFFTPHCYLLRWAHPKTDARSLKRAVKCLMNPKTRASIHGIFAIDMAEPPLLHLSSSSSPPLFHTLDTTQQHQNQHGLVPAGNGNGGGMMSSSSPVDNSGISSSASVKSVNYYCDIFRRQDPDLWLTSVKAYQKFLSDRELQSADNADDDSAVDTCSPRALLGCAEQSSSRPKRRRQSTNSNFADSSQARRQMVMVDRQALATFGSLPSSLASSAMLETPSSSSLLTDFGSDFNSDDGSSCDQVLVSVAGHSWHKFLSQRNRWISLGLSYSGKDDWERQEMGFLVEHMFSLMEEDSNCGYAAGEMVTLAVVPQFAGSFDAPNIEMAVARARATRMVRLTRLVDDLLACLEAVDTREPFTVVSLCRMTDRQTRSTMSLALLVSHGSNSQRFGVFPHNDAMLGRLVAGSEGLWHACASGGNSGNSGNSGSGSGGLAPMAVEEGEEEGPQAAFAYAQSGVRYAFFVRRKGHFFEMTRDDDWVPTMVPARPRAAWAACVMARDALLGVLRRDAEKVLAGMVELFGLRLFCYGFFEALALPGSGGGGGGGAVAGGARSPPSRRVSDDPPSQMQARQGQRPPRGRRGGGCGGARASASGALGSSALSGHTSPYAGSSSGGLPYRRPPGHSAGAGATTTTTAAAAAAIGRAPSTAFLSPQARHYSAFPACDMAAMSVSLPNSPFGFALDGGQQMAQAGGGGGSGGGMAHEALFPALGDDGLGIGGGGMHPAAAGQRFGVAATPPMGYAGGGGGALDASALFSGVVAAAAAAGGGSPAAAFWDLAAHPHHHAHSHLHSPAMALGFGSPPSMAGLAGSMTEMSVAAVAAAASIALYPPPHPTPTMLGWDDMALSAGVLGGGGGGAHRHHHSHNLHSSDMLMQLAQPSPTLSHYNLSAQATPAFEAYSTPVLGHLQHAAVPSPYIPSLSGAGSAAMMQPDHQPFLMHAAEGEGPSAMAAYFGVAPPPPSLPSLPPPPPLNHNHHRATNSVAGSQETLASSADALLAKGYMYAAAVSSGSTPAHQMDVEFSSH